MRRCRFSEVIAMVRSWKSFDPDESAPPPEKAKELPRSIPQFRIEPGGHTGAIASIAVDTAGQWLVSAGKQDGTIRVWRLAGPSAGTLERTIRVPRGRWILSSIFAVALSPDGCTIAIGGLLGTSENYYTHVFDRATGRLTKRLSALAFHLTFDAGGKRLALLHGYPFNGSLRLYDLDIERGWRHTESAGPRIGQGGPDSDIKWVDFDKDGRLAAVCEDGRLHLLARQQARRDYTRWLNLQPSLVEFESSGAARLPNGRKPGTVAFSRDGSRIAVGYWDSGPIDIFDGQSLNRLASADTQGIDNGNLRVVAWSTDGGTLFAAGSYQEGNHFPVLSWSNGGLGPRLKSIQAATAPVIGLHPLADGRLAIGAEDGIFVFAPGGPDEEPRPCWSRTLVGADFREQMNAIRVSRSGDRVAFGLERSGKRPALLDLSGPKPTLSLDPYPGSLSDLILPLDGLGSASGASGLDLASKALPDCIDLQDFHRQLRLHDFEKLKCLAWIPAKPSGRAGFCLGTDWALRAYNDRCCKRWERDNMPTPVLAVNVTPDGRYAVAAYGDGTLRWHLISNGAQILAFYADPDGADGQPRWVVWTPLGHYVTSPGGEDLIGWHVNRGWNTAPDFLDSVDLRQQCNRPDVVARVLEAGDPVKALRLANAARPDSWAWWRRR